MAKRAINYNVIENFGVLSTKEFDRTDWNNPTERVHVKKTKEVRKVSWNGGEPKIEIREWETINGIEKPAADGAKITFTDEEWDAFLFLLAQMEPEEEAV